MRKDRIEARLKALGLTQFQAAEKAGRHAHFIYDFMIGRKRSFKGDGPIRLAQALECSIEYLTGESDDVGRPPLSAAASYTYQPGSLPVAGIVEAGVFRRPGAISPALKIDLPPFPSYPAEAQVLYVVRGGGLDARGIAEGTVLTAVKVEALSEPIRNGEIVVVEHFRNGGREVEVSAREIQHYTDRIEFHALSRSENIPSIILKDGKTNERRGRLKIVAIVIGATILL